jgi:FHA domain/von Willebrand factor type A domain
MKNRVSAILLISLAILLLPLATQAQDQPPEVVAISTVPEIQANGLRLNTFFVVRDKATGRVIPPNKIEQAKFLLSDEDEPVSAVLENPTTPIKIALLLDESGSMAPYVASVRAAAKDAIAKAPDQAQFAIFKFSDVASQSQIAPDLAFTPKTDSATINTFIDTQYDSRPNAPTCLYNIALQAIHYLAQNAKPEERRAIILFTDGKDERLTVPPTNPLPPCSDRSLDDVTREADPDSPTPTPIYTVGLCAEASCGTIDKSVLDRMSSQTKAISRVNTADKLTDLFYNIMDDLKGQRLAQAIIAPCQEKQVTLLVTLVDARDPIRGIVPFTNERCYTPRASVVIGEPKPNAKENTYLFPATINNLSPLDLRSLAIQVIDPNNTTVYTATLQDTPFQTPAQDKRDVIIPILARSMDTPGDYFLRVSALTPDGVPFLSKPKIQGRTAQVLGEIQFKHTLSANAQITILSVRPKEDLSAITITVQLDHKEAIAPENLGFIQYQAKFFKDTTEVDSFGPNRIDLTNTGPSFVIEVPLPEKVRTITADTPYKVSITLLAPADARIGKGPQNYDSNQQPFTLTLPAQKSWWERVRPVVISPFTLWALLVVVLAAIGAYVYSRYRSRRVIPRPFNSATVLPSMPPANKPARPRRPTEPSVVINTPPPIATQIHTEAAGETVLHTGTEVATAQRKPRVWIKIVQTVDPSQVREQTLGLPCVIGRENAHVVITGDPKISRAHAEIRYEDGQFVIVDRNSVNGTFVANTQIAKGGSMPLIGTTTVRLGPNTTIEVKTKG